MAGQAAVVEVVVGSQVGFACHAVKGARDVFTYAQPVLVDQAVLFARHATAKPVADQGQKRNACAAIRLSAVSHADYSQHAVASGRASCDRLCSAVFLSIDRQDVPHGEAVEGNQRDEMGDHCYQPGWPKAEEAHKPKPVPDLSLLLQQVPCSLGCSYTLNRPHTCAYISLLLH